MSLYDITETTTTKTITTTRTGKYGSKWEDI